MEINGSQWKSYQAGALGIRPRTYLKIVWKKKTVLKTAHLHLKKAPKCCHVWGTTFWGIHSGDPEHTKKQTGTHDKINENQWKTNENQWKPIKTNENQWNQWKPMKANENQWKPMKINENQLKTNKNQWNRKHLYL